MTHEEKIRLTLQFLLDNNVDSFIYPDGLKKYWQEKGFPDNEQLSTLTHLHNDGLIEVFPRDCISKGQFPGQLKISFKGIKFIDDSKLLPAVDRKILGLERQSIIRAFVFGAITFFIGIFTPILTDFSRKVLMVSEEQKETIIKLELKHNKGCCFLDTNLHISPHINKDTLK